MMENTTPKGLIKWRKKTYYNKITPRFSPPTNGGEAYFWKTEKDLQELRASAINLHMYG